MQEKNSLALSIACLPKKKREKIISELTNDEVLSLLYDWKFWARKKQLIPTVAFVIWLILTGRGWGKTRTGAEFIRQRVESGAKRIALIGKTPADVRDTMIEVEESSLLKTSPPWELLEYQPSKRRVTWYNPDGSTIKAVGSVYSGESPDQLRGPQHDTAWVDELAKFKYPVETWDNFEFGFRKSRDPKCIVTTTPRPISLIKKLIEDPDVHVTRGHTLENRANLSPRFTRRIMARYDGTRLGKQELAGKVLDDNPSALWKRDDIDTDRVSEAPELRRIVVAVDPKGKHKVKSSETGIIIAGVGHNNHGYILADYSLNAKPKRWGSKVIEAYRTFSGDRVVGEVNYGGDMVEYVLKSIDNHIPFKMVTATRGKTRRAEPVSSLYEQHKVHHVGCLPTLEDQMCAWDPSIPDREQDSPDRMDALVWALFELMITDNPEFMIGRA